MSVASFCPRPLIAALAVVSFSCADARKEAVYDLVAFMEAAPFRLAPAESTETYYNVTVVDSAQDWYSRLHGYLTPRDTTRAEPRYTPAGLLFGMPITELLESVSFRDVGSDTLQATLVFHRPNRQAFERRFVEDFEAMGSLPPTSEDQAEFRDLIRVHMHDSAIADIDAIFLTVVNGPHIVSIRSAYWIRDSIIADSLSGVAVSHLRSLVRDARFTIQELWTEIGGHLEGSVDPGQIGWYRNDRPYAWLAVHCQDSRAGTVAGAVLIDEKLGDYDPAQYVCAWPVGSNLAADNVRVRLVAHVGRDSVFGPWSTPQ